MWVIKRDNLFIFSSKKVTGLAFDSWNVRLRIDSSTDVSIFRAASRRRQHDPPERRYISTRIHGVTAQKTATFIHRRENLKSDKLLVDIIETEHNISGGLALSCSQVFNSWIFSRNERNGVVCFTWACAHHTLRLPRNFSNIFAMYHDFILIFFLREKVFLHTFATDFTIDKTFICFLLIFAMDFTIEQTFSVFSVSQQRVYFTYVAKGKNVWKMYEGFHVTCLVFNKSERCR